MAFEGLNQFTDQIIEMAEKERPDVKQKCQYEQMALTILKIYHETALRSAKFKAQRIYCEKAIFRLSPGYYKGYFKKEKPI